MTGGAWRALLSGESPGPTERPAVVAELSANHDGSLERALATVDAVAAAGADAVKLQTYLPDTMVLDVDAPAFRVSGEHGLWGGRHLHELYAEAHTPWEWHAEIFQRARSAGLTPFSSPFDASAVELLESLDCALYKIASAELVDLPLIRLVASTGRPVVLSTGMATIAEVDAALSAARSAGPGPFVLLACTAAYPAPPEEARLGSIAVLREAFGVPVGLSDHTPGIGVSVAAVALGACLLEKHVALDREGTGPDAAFSLDVDELALLVRESAAARAAVSPARFGPTDAERETLRFRRSLWVAQDVRAGDEVSAANVRALRPAGGLSPAELDRVLGRRFAADAARGTPLSWDLL